MTVEPMIYIILTLATYRITRFAVKDVIFSKIRDKIWKKWDPATTKIGYLFTCYWCFSIWAAMLVVGAFILAPTVTIVVSLVLSISSIVGYVAERVD
jgi:hypothetical protein